ncbi:MULTISPECIES: acyl carrier protein [Streptomyces]|uniref:Acyl carrier protein n=1 Tax=Streptomyces venezuelae TaxID=54571 RepID=A0A5P2AM07_STRVZ|nr:acyl carrier protein [Streptomyces venezuelae]QES19075.1 acyl carrier protein [Streptomyces venezuelae]
MTTPSPDTVLTRLRALLAARLGPEYATFPDGADLRVSLGEGYDSLTALECITGVEAEFGIEVDLVGDDVRYWFATTERMARFVADRLEDAAALGSGR